MRLGSKQSAQILELVSVLKREPIPYTVYDLVKLKGKDDAYRIRIGDLRIVYQVDFEHSTVSIEFLGPRGKAYKGK